MKRSFDNAFKNNDDDDDDDDNIVLISIPKRVKDAWQYYAYSEYTKSLEESTLNYNKENDTIYCPILLEDIPVDQSITLTCCWNAIHRDYIKLINHECCLLCRNNVTIYYIIVQLYPYWSDQRGEYTFKVGFHPQWPLYKLIDKIEKRLEYWCFKVTKLYINCLGDKYRLYKCNALKDEKTCHEYNIRNTTRILCQ